MKFYRNQQLIDPDGYTSRVILCAGNYVTVIRLYAHKVERVKTFAKVSWSGT